MKAIIDNKTYDTDAAKLVSSFDNGCTVGDLDYYGHEVYLTEDGGHFVLCSGGARNILAIYDNASDSTCSGDLIIPLADQKLVEELAEKAIWNVISEDELSEWIQLRNLQRLTPWQRRHCPDAYEHTYRVVYDQ